MNKRILGQLFEKSLVAFIIIVLLISGSVILSPPTAVSSAEVSGNITLKDLPVKGHPKLDSALSALSSQNGSAAIGPLTSAFAPQTATGTIRVIIEAARGQTNNVSTSARALGSIEGSYGDLIQMVVPVSQLNSLAGLSNAKLVRLPMKPLPSELPVISQGVPLINADDWQLASYNGTGVKIGILDVGFSGYTTRQSEGELPTGANLTTWWAPSIGNAGSNIHGTACAEIIYDIAPFATYYFANFSTDVEYGQAVNWLISQGVNIISCSVGWPTGGPGDGTGFFCQVIDSAKAAGILWAQAIGNQAQRHWQGTWSNPDADVWHNFSGNDEGNTITVISGDLIVAALKWNDAWYSSSNDYDLLLYNSSGSLVAYSASIQNGDDNPWELLGYYATYTGVYHIAIGALASPAPATFHLYSYYHNLKYQTASSSFTVPADSFSAVAVGAVNYATPTAIEVFSSRGPTDDGRVIPALVAPDGVSTRSYSSYTPPTFSGTSASAPCTAGTAALVKQRFPTYTPAQIQAFLEGRAADLGTAGKDNLYGAGRLDLGSASNNFTLTMAVSGGVNIDNVTVYFRFIGNASAAKFCLKTHNTIYEASTLELYSYWYTTSHTWTLNPYTSAKWTWDEINAMEIGVALSGINTSPDWSRCTQVYAEIKYNDGSVQQTLTLRPTGDGSEISIDYMNPVSPTTHFDKIDEASPDENASYIENKNGAPGTWQRDLFTIPDHIPGGGSSVTPAAGTHSYATGTIVNINAIPDQGWQFTSWTGDVADPHSATTNVTINTDKTVTANFNQTAGTLTIIVDGSGSVNPSVGSHSYTLSTNITLTATPSSGWAFVRWTGDVSNNQTATTNITMDTNKTVIANFTRTDSILRLAVSGSGTVSPSQGHHVYPINTLVDITATPATNWAFVNWTGGNVTSTSSATTNTTMDWDKTLTANFVRINSTLTMAISGSGTTSLSPIAGNNTYPVGTSVNITATPASGYQFVNWTGNVATVANVNSGSTNVTMNGDYTITANFSLIPNPPPPSIGGGGGGGGGGGSGGGSTNNARITGLMGLINDAGKIATDVEASSLDSKLNLKIPQGTIAKNKVGSRLTSITVTTLSEPNAPPAGMNFVGSVYDLGPGEATFNPPINFTLKYNPGNIPEEVSEDKLYLATWDETNKTWNRIDFVINTETNTFTTTIPHFSQYAILASTQTASFTLSEIKVNPTQINTGDSVVVSVKVANPGNLTGDYQVTLKINSVIQETKSVTLDASANTTVSFSLTGGKAGTYSVDIDNLHASFTVAGKPAVVKVESLTITPSEINPGEFASVSVNVTNTGESEGTYKLALKLNTAIAETREITLAGGSNQLVTFKVTSDKPGKQLVEVDSLLGVLLIKGEVPPQTQIPLPLEKTESILKTETGIIPQVTTPIATPEPTMTKKSNAWIFGGIAGGILLVGVCIFYITRRRKHA